jgi:hypothetical protein
MLNTLKLNKILKRTIAGDSGFTPTPLNRYGLKLKPF